jgi:DNA-binding response OmpR family regulator
MNVNTETILLVDDEVTVRGVLRSALEREGFTVVDAGNYYDAMKVAGDCEFLDLAVIDVSLPGPNGCELAKRLMSKCPDLPVLFISGYTGAEVCRHYGIQLHDLHFMAKPIDAKSLGRRVRTLLDESQTNSSDVQRADQRAPLRERAN